MQLCASFKYLSDSEININTCSKTILHLQLTVSPIERSEISFKHTPLNSVGEIQITVIALHVQHKSIVFYWIFSKETDIRVRLAGFL